MSRVEYDDNGIRVVTDGHHRTLWRGDCRFCTRLATVRDPMTGTYPPHDRSGDCDRTVPGHHCDCRICWTEPLQAIRSHEYGPTPTQARGTPDA